MAHLHTPVGPAVEIQQVDVEVALPNGGDQAAVPPHWLASKPPAVQTNHAIIFEVFAPSGIGMLHLHDKIVAGGNDHPRRPNVQILPPAIIVVAQISKSETITTYMDSSNRIVDVHTDVDSKQQIQIYDAEGALLHKYKDKHRCYDDGLLGFVMDLLCFPLLWGCANDATFTVFEEKRHVGAESYIVIRTPYVKDMYKFITEAVHKPPCFCCCSFTGTGNVFDGATLTLYKGSDPASYARSMDFLKAAHLAGLHLYGNPMVRSSIKQGDVGDGQWHLWQTTSVGLHSTVCKIVFGTIIIIQSVLSMLYCCGVGPLRTVSTIPITWPLHFNVKMALNRVSTIIVHALDDQHLALSFDK